MDHYSKHHIDGKNKNKKQEYTPATNSALVKRHVYAI